MQPQFHLPNPQTPRQNTPTSHNTMTIATHTPPLHSKKQHARLGILRNELANKLPNLILINPLQTLLPSGGEPFITCMSIRECT